MSRLPANNHQRWKSHRRRRVGNPGWSASGTRGGGHLLPVIKEELKDVFYDKDLIRKLNLLFISDGIKWIGENWSKKWNENQIKNILTNEIAEDEADLKNTYAGKVLNF